MKLLGFINNENTCYINSILQCLIYSETFIKNINIPELSEIIKLINLTDSSESGYTIVDLKKFNTFFFKNATIFKRYQQSDAHEFLIFFLDLLGDLQKEYQGKSILSIKCKCCGTLKKTFEDFSSINLNVKNNLVSTFMEYLKVELHDDPNNLYFCDTCKKETITEQKITLHTLPNVLIIVLKRWNVQGTIDYPSELSIKEQGVLKKYKLTGIVNHYGHVNNGHYTCNISVNGEYFFIDDASVNKSEYSINKNAYILLYTLF
jgi:ubiquitin carboxyl-terminal hydrolase 36/42